MINVMLNLFEQVLLEAEGDEVPDVPELPTDDSPPDLSDDVSDITDDEPPDIDDGGFEDINLDDTGENEASNESIEDLDINEKISAVMNSNLYQKFLSLITVLSDHLSIIKDHRDEIYSSFPKTLGMEESLKRLKENINLYLANNFINNNYSSNLLFFNKCSNLLNLLDMSFAKGLKNSK